MYDDANYASSRLTDTIIRKGEDPVYVTGVGEGAKKPVVKYIYLHDYIRGMAGQKKDYIEEFNITPFTLGFVNVAHHGISYVGRIPLRNDWKQGLRLQNIRTIWGMDRRLISYQQLYPTLVGKYPSLGECLDSTLNMGIPKAFSRNFAICLDQREEKVNLLYKYFGIVGDMLNGRFTLHREYEYLEEVLHESLEKDHG